MQRSGARSAWYAISVIKRSLGGVLFFAVGLCAIGGSAGCHKSKTYETEVEITRYSVVRKDEAGKPVTADAELSFYQCPGDQFETIRGDAAFSTCMARYSVGQKIKAKLEHHWSDEGHYKWTVHKLGDCDRVVDPNDEASSAFIRECEDFKVNGSKVGFSCDLKAERKLTDKCPWFRRH